VPNTTTADASYAGDTNHSTTTGTHSQTVNKAASSTVVTGSPASPTSFGTSVTFTATVTGPGGTPSGTVQFKDGASNLGSPVALAGGAAPLYIARAAGGAHRNTAVYSGDTDYLTSTSANYPHTVDQAASSTVVTGSPASPTSFGTSVTFTATVTGPGGTPSGTVQFKDGASNLGSPVALAGGAAQL